MTGVDGFPFSGSAVITGSFLVSSSTDDHSIINLKASSSSGPAFYIQQDGGGEYFYCDSQYGRRSFRIKQSANGAAQFEFYGSHSTAENGTSNSALVVMAVGIPLLGIGICICCCICCALKFSNVEH